MVFKSLLRVVGGHNHGENVLAKHSLAVRIELSRLHNLRAWISSHYSLLQLAIRGHVQLSVLVLSILLCKVSNVVIRNGELRFGRVDQEIYCRVQNRLPMTIIHNHAFLHVQRDL